MICKIGDIKKKQVTIEWQFPLTLFLVSVRLWTAIKMMFPYFVSTYNGIFMLIYFIALLMNLSIPKHRSCDHDLEENTGQ
jgi:hypothetical protein